MTTWAIIMIIGSSQTGMEISPESSPINLGRVSQPRPRFPSNKNVLVRIYFAAIRKVTTAFW
jgi:hypothetical protein